MLPFVGVTWVVSVSEVALLARLPELALPGRLPELALQLRLALARPARPVLARPPSQS